jgi:hypothetical protein
MPIAGSRAHGVGYRFARTERARVFSSDWGRQGAHLDLALGGVTNAEVDLKFGAKPAKCRPSVAVSRTRAGEVRLGEPKRRKRLV